MPSNPKSEILNRQSSISSSTPRDHPPHRWQTCRPSTAGFPGQPCQAAPRARADHGVPAPAPPGSGSHLPLPGILHPAQLPLNGRSPLFELPGGPLFHLHLLLPKQDAGLPASGQALAGSEGLEPAQKHRKTIAMARINVTGGFQILASRMQCRMRFFIHENTSKKCSPERP